MTTWLFALLVMGGALLVGTVGALVGTGGGMMLVPMLILLFHVNPHYAMGASLICVIVTSSSGTAAYIREGYTNLRIAMFLLAVAAAGGVVGALISGRLPAATITIIFGMFLLLCGALSWRRKEDVEQTAPSDPLAVRLGLEGSYPALEGSRPYRVYHVFPALGAMGFAGVLAGLLGIGAGAVNVLVMDQLMGLPYKVSSTTSNFMIGITAAAAAGVYFNKGFIDPGLVMPVMLGVFVGASTGARVLPRAKTRWLRALFNALLFVLAVEMIYKGFAGKL